MSSETAGKSAPSDIERLLDVLLNDARVRKEFRENPDAVAGRVGVVLEDDTREALLSLDWSASNEELHERISKSMCTA